MLSVFLQYLQSQKRYSLHTIKAYRRDIEQLMCELHVTEAEVTTLTHRQLRLWCSDLMERVSARTVKRKISAVSAFFVYCVRQGVITQNPTDLIVKPKSKKRLPFFYEAVAMKTLLDAIVECGDYAALRNHTIIELFYGTGIRLAELVGLRLADVNIDRQNIKVFGKKKKERIVPLTPHLIKELKLYLEVYGQNFEMHPDNPLFIAFKKQMPSEIKSMSPGEVYRMVHKTLKSQGINGKKSPHVLRHSYATHLLNNGADLNSIKTLLGHTSLAATQVYTHNDIDKLLRSYANAHPHA
jgi:integrase/recombinase XerC